jgi:hypothetical protein
MQEYGWQHPDDSWIKINTDIGIAFDALKAGVGGIARNTFCFIGAWSKPYPGVTYPMIAEALARRDGVISGGA